MNFGATASRDHLLNAKCSDNRLRRREASTEPLPEPERPWPSSRLDCPDARATIAISRSPRRNHEAREAKRLSLPEATAASAWPQPAFSSLKARKSRFRVAINRHWMKRSPSWDRKRTAIALTLRLRRTARGFSAELAKDFGKLDIVFANAGISGTTPTGTTDEAIFEKVVRTNLNGAFFTVNSAAPLMNDNGSIIFNGSVHTYLGQPGVAAYAATKGELVSMARSIAADLAPRKICANVVAPGATKISHLEARGARLCHGREGIRKSFRLLLFHGSTCPVGRAGRCGQGRRFFLPRTICRTSTRSS